MPNSLNEFIEAEGAEYVEPAQGDPEPVEAAPEGEAPGEPAESPEPTDSPEPLSDATEPSEPDAPTDGEPAEVAETPTEKPAEDEPDEIYELTKRGWPKPKYTDEDLKNNPQALEERRHWHRVWSQARREEKEWRRQYDGIDPQEAKQHKAVYDDLTGNEKYEGVRAFIGMSEHPAGEDARTFVNALSDSRHPDHLRALRAWQSIRAGGAPPSSDPRPAPSPQSVEAFTDEYGGIDPQKFAQWQQAHDRQIAERVLEAVKQAQKSSAAPTAPAQPQQTDVVKQFADFNGLDAEKIKPLLARQLYLRRAAGKPDPEDGARGVKELWDAHLAEREQNVRAERQVETERLKRVSTPPPREAVPDTGTPAQGSTLYEFATRQTGSRD